MAKSWLQLPPRSPFSIANIPFGIISTKSSPKPRPAIAIGSHALCLRTFAQNDGFSKLPTVRSHLNTFQASTLNGFASLGRQLTGDVRKYLQGVLSSDSDFSSVLQADPSLQQKCLIPLSEVEMSLPFHIGDYTDFYVGSMFRGPANALQPNYSHLPVGYHGRSSSIVVSGTPIRRPWGQILSDPTAQTKRPTFSPSKKLDMELELGAFICQANALGDPVPIDDAARHIFGYVLLNDWSARDIQQWEYVPLGPFNGKNFGSTISAWVVHADALEPFRAKGLDSDVELLPYLQERDARSSFDVTLEVDLTTSKGTTATVSKTNAKNLLFSFPQMLAHHSAGGCPMRVGDLLGSGTISGSTPDSVGSLLEQNENGKKTIRLGSRDGSDEEEEERTFLEDGDTVTLRGWAEDEQGNRVGFGDCVGRIEPARQL